jgi:DUF2905 family protein
MSRTLIVLGLILVLVGLTWPWLARLGLGRLPGDMAIERHHFRLYFPLSTSLLISLLLSIIVSLLLWLFRK